MGRVIKFKWLVLLLLFIGGCTAITDGGNLPLGGTGVFGVGGNPATRPTPGFTEVEVAPATSTTDTSSNRFLSSSENKLLALQFGGIEIDEIRIVEENFDFDDNVSPGVEGPGFSIIRLVQNGNIVDDALPEIGSAILPDGDYSTLDLQYKILAANEIPPEAANDPVVTEQLVGNSIVIEGSFLFPVQLPILNLRIPFRFISKQTSTIRIETPNAINFSGLVLQFLFIAHKVQLWFDMNVANLLQSLNATLLPIVNNTVTGVLILDANSPNASIRNIALEIQGNIDTGFRLAPSDDGFFQESDVLESSVSFVLIP